MKLLTIGTNRTIPAFAAAVMYLSGVFSFAHSQACAGLPQLDREYLSIAAGATSHKFVSETNAAVTAGRGLFFGTVTGARKRDPDLDATIWELDLLAGINIPSGLAGWKVCPTLDLSHSWGPTRIALEPDDFWRRTERAAALGIARELQLSNRIRLHPVGSMRFTHANVRLVHKPLGSNLNPTIQNASDTYWLASFGFGVSGIGPFTIRPGVSIPLGAAGSKSPLNEALAPKPFGRDSGDPSWHITVSLGFGGPRK